MHVQVLPKLHAYKNARIRYILDWRAFYSAAYFPPFSDPTEIL